MNSISIFSFVLLKCLGFVSMAPQYVISQYVPVQCESGLCANQFVPQQLGTVTLQKTTSIDLPIQKLIEYQYQIQLIKQLTEQHKLQQLIKAIRNQQNSGQSTPVQSGPQLPKGLDISKLIELQKLIARIKEENPRLVASTDSSSSSYTPTQPQGSTSNTIPEGSAAAPEVPLPGSTTPISVTATASPMPNSGVTLYSGPPSNSSLPSNSTLPSNPSPPLINPLTNLPIATPVDGVLLQLGNLLDGVLGGLSGITGAAGLASGKNPNEMSSAVQGDMKQLEAVRPLLGLKVTPLLMSLGPVLNSVLSILVPVAKPVGTLG